MGMKITHFGTGSSGNAVLVDRTLIDCGLDINYYAFEYDTLVITHAHSDHIKHIYHALKNTTHFYAPNDVIEHIKHQIRRHPKKRAIEQLMQDKFKVMTNYFALNHDVPCYGYDFGDYVHLGDTAYPDTKYIPKGRKLYAIESNYDELSLNATNRPDNLITRIKGTHMSNEQACALALELKANKTMFIHLSRDANSPALAKATHLMMGYKGIYPKDGEIIETH